MLVLGTDDETIPQPQLRGNIAVSDGSGDKTTLSQDSLSYFLDAQGKSCTISTVSGLESGEIASRGLRF